MGTYVALKGSRDPRSRERVGIPHFTQGRQPWTGVPGRGDSGLESNLELPLALLSNPDTLLTVPCLPVKGRQ